MEPFKRRMRCGQHGDSSVWQSISSCKPLW
jgi:hypothetical protein